LLALAKEGRAAFREQARLPRRTRWLDRYERGLLVFLEADSPPGTATARR
jgi:DNA topoisomerase-1